MWGVSRRLGRRRPLELRWRLGASVAAVLAISSAVTFVAVYRSTGSQLRKQIESEVAGDSTSLSRALTSSGARSERGLQSAAARYIRAQPFSSSSTLLFVRFPGGATVTNRPELFSPHAPDDGETATQQAAENRLATKLLQAHPGFSTVQMPDVGELRLLRRTTHLPTPASSGVRSVSVGVGEPLTSVERAQDVVSRSFILAGLIALAGALIAALVIGTRLSRPLRRMAATAALIDAGEMHHRMHDTDSGAREVRVLAESFNHMLDRLADAFAGQRAFVADASHELRTPLTVIRGQLEVLAAQSRPSPEEIHRVEQLVLAEVGRITRLVDDLLLLARSEQTAFLRIESVALEEFVSELWDSFTLIDEQRSFELGPIPAGNLQADPDRLAQALRNLVMNAIAHTSPQTGRVLLHVEQPRAGWVRFAVEDDGPGIPEDQREAVFDRFHRTDEGRARAVGGAGLGLAIVKAIAEAHGGRARAGTAAAGGARIELDLPGFVPAPRPLPRPAAEATKA